MENVKAEKATKQVSDIDIQKETELISLNKLMLEAQLLQQQLKAGAMELRSVKIANLQKIIEHVDGEFKEKINDEISKLLSELISIQI